MNTNYISVVTKGELVVFILKRLSIRWEKEIVEDGKGRIEGGDCVGGIRHDEVFDESGIVKGKGLVWSFGVVMDRKG